MGMSTTPRASTNDSAAEPLQPTALNGITRRCGTVDPEQCGGRPYMRGMRIRVIDVLDLFAAELNLEQIFDDGTTIHPRWRKTFKSPSEAPLPRRYHSVQRALSKAQFVSAQPTRRWLASGSRSDLRPLRGLQLLFELIRQRLQRRRTPSPRAAVPSPSRETGN